MAASDRVVVVGTGPAGSTAALFLARAGLNPLLLEAGSGKPALGLTARVRGLTLFKSKPPLSPRPDLLCDTDPAAVLFEELAPGGLSNHWSCAVPRFAPDDFGDAERAGEAYRWPLDYADLVPWYERVEPLLKIAGSERDVARLPACRVARPRQLGKDWLRVADLLAARGRDVTPMPYAYGGESTATRAGTPFNAFKRLAEPAALEGQLSLRLGARVLRLEWCPAEDRVTAVIARDPSTGAEERIACRAVVLAAGAVASATILLQSRDAEHPRGLGNESGLVGRYLHDHPLAKLVVRLRDSISNEPASYITRPTLDRSSPLYAAAFMQWGGVFERLRCAVAGHPNRSARLGFSIFGTMIPTPEDGIALPESSSGAAPLRYSLRYPAAATALLEQARDELVETFASAGWAPHVEVFRIEPPGTSVHYGGTCRMHRSPSFGVVNQHGTVFGARNVAVADSSVFTTGPEKNPVLTAMALAARTSQHLADQLRGGDL